MEVKLISEDLLGPRPVESWQFALIGRFRNFKWPEDFSAVLIQPGRLVQDVGWVDNDKTVTLTLVSRLPDGRQVWSERWLARELCTDALFDLSGLLMQRHRRKIDQLLTLAQN